MKEKETKRDKFVRLAEARTNKIIDMLQLLGNCSNSNVYDYTQQDVDKIFNAIDAEVKEAKKKFEREFSNDQQVTRVTPRAFITLSDDDSAVLPANGTNYYLECYRHDVPASLHIYPTGGHGWGIRSSFAFHVEMMQELKAWLHSF